ncbi:MAG: FAD-binding monooxygenase, partial [Alphaproteobacteria bacterium]|nr:FAD-binding monooxygenase [Alphaproteobacteria bacterium]
MSTRSRSPDMQDKAQAQRFDILISGFGPAGATLAALLGQRGLRVAVFDKYREIYPLPRAVALDHEVLRIFQQVGLSEDIPRVIAPYRTTIYAGADGAPVQQIETIAEPYPLAWPPNATFDQPALESALRARVAAQPNVEVFLEHEVCGYEEHTQGVRLHVRSTCGAQKIFSGAFLIACDGAQSPLRQQAGIGLEDMEFEQDWIVCDVRVNGAALQRLPQTNVQYCTPQRPATFVVCPHNHRRWEFRVLPDEAFSHDVPEDVLWRLLQPWLAKGEGEIWRTASYRFAARMAQDWRKGRLFLAGDAAHQMPPFLGQGMCQGIRDAANLAWKLAQVLAGPAPFRIL